MGHPVVGRENGPLVNNVPEIVTENGLAVTDESNTLNKNGSGHYMSEVVNENGTLICPFCEAEEPKLSHIVTCDALKPVKDVMSQLNSSPAAMYKMIYRSSEEAGESSSTQKP